MNFFRAALNAIRHRPILLALIAGAIFPLSLAPFNFWPAALISVGLLFQLSKTDSPFKASQLGFMYGLGFFGTGVSWVYVSINQFGGASPLLAGFLTLIFSAGLALLFAVQSYLFARLTGPSATLKFAAFPALWVLFEWLRSWLLSGFPWLYVGYAGLESPLAGWVPIIGVYGCSLLIVFSAAALSNLLPQSFSQFISAPKTATAGTADSDKATPRNPTHQLTWLLVAIIPWVSGFALQQVQWVKSAPGSSEIKVALVQGNIAQLEKWKPHNLPAILQRYQRATLELPQQEIILWPESAIPQFVHNVEPFLEKMRQQLPENSTLITGLLEAVPTDKQGYQIYNSVLALQQQYPNQPHQIYHKRKLVPFGEFVPLENYLRGLIEFFNLPMSKFSVGNPEQPLLNAGELTLLPLLCYEIAYPKLALEKSADLIITISNDSWFGNSIGPLQHLQMAQFRALEIGRYLIRATNNGVSAIVDHKGRILKKTEQFKLQVLTGQVKKMTGETPYFRYGSSPLLLFCVGILLAAFSGRVILAGKTRD